MDHANNWMDGWMDKWAYDGQNRTDGSDGSAAWPTSFSPLGYG